MARTLDDTVVAELAAEHETARRTVTSIDPVTRRHPDATIDDAYAIQQAWVDQQLADGAVLRGHKIGLTSRAMQQAMRIDTPDSGSLLDHMWIDDGGSFAAAHHLDPKIEVELAFVLGSSIAPGDGPVSVDDVYAATDHVVGALELIDARSHRVHPVDGRTRTVVDTIADNAANSGIVVGSVRVRPGDSSPGALRWAGAICTRNGVVEETGLGAGVLNDPAVGIVWLAERLHGLGVTLEAGQTILAGSFTRPIDCRAGDEFVVDFRSPGLDLGVVTVSVT